MSIIEWLTSPQFAPCTQVPSDLVTTITNLARALLRTAHSIGAHLHHQFASGVPALRPKIARGGRLGQSPCRPLSSTWNLVVARAICPVAEEVIAEAARGYWASDALMRSPCVSPALGIVLCASRNTSFDGVMLIA